MNVLMGKLYGRFSRNNDYTAPRYYPCDIFPIRIVFHRAFVSDRIMYKPITEILYYIAVIVILKYYYRYRDYRYEITEWCVYDAPTIHRAIFLENILYLYVHCNTRQAFFEC